MGFEIFLTVISILIALFSMIIALAATINTICQGFLTRQHNKLSVRPILRIDRIINHNDFAVIFLINNGTGPALIESITTFVDGKIIPHGINEERTKAMLSIGLAPDKIVFNTINKNEPYAPGAKQMLYQTSYKISDAHEALVHHFNAFSKISIKIIYRSIYNEKFELIDDPISYSLDYAKGCTFFS